MTNEKMNNNMNEEMNQKVHPKMQPLSDGNMEKVSGGRKTYNQKGQQIGDTTWHWVGSMWNHYQVESYTYYPCPKCGKPMHVGTLGWYYCDPCDYKSMFAEEIVWRGGSLQDLKDASL